jgi:uncharacterized membrane protein (UPF0127 family)
MTRWWVKAVFITLAIIMGSTWLWWQMTVDESTLRLNGASYHVSVMRTETELEQGLSGTNSLGKDQAMVFVFPRDDKWGMWMKDMKYPIDMVWLNNDKQVVYTVKNAQPASYPNTFKPSTISRYVIELPSGTIDQTGIKIGDPAGLPSGV